MTSTRMCIILLQFLLIKADSSDLDQFLHSYNHSAVLAESSYWDAYWEKRTNGSEWTDRLFSRASTDFNAVMNDGAVKADLFLKNRTDLNATIERLLRMMANHDQIPSDHVQLELEIPINDTFYHVSGDMLEEWKKTTVCSIDEQTLTPDCAIRWVLNPHLETRMRSSKNYTFLKYVWESWHNETGRKILPLYKQLVISRDAPTMWTDHQNLWHELLPLYEQLHAYVRRKLRQRYSDQSIIDNSAIPAHVLGDMYSRFWYHIVDITAPYPEKSIDITDSMLSQNYTTKLINEMADDFFKSMGLIPLPAAFWEKSIFEKPAHTEVICHASAWDFYRFNDVRITMCSKIDTENFITVVHEQGHVQQFLQYAHLPYSFRKAPNQGFHEAIGDTIALSALTPDYLHKIGLLSNFTPHDEEQRINSLFLIAMWKLPSIFWAYSLDQWIQSVFSGRVKIKSMNNAWWDARRKYQGITPPSDRSDPGLFDPGSIYHLVYNYQPVHYFVAGLLQFQFYQALCNASDHSGELHKCNLYNNTRAGSLFSKVMRLGASVDWHDALQEMTGERNLSTNAIRKYFQPLMIWLKEKNRGECFGWGQEWPARVMDTLERNRC